MPRFSVNLGFLWPELPLLERIDAAAACGFRAVELHWPYDTSAQQVRERCERHRLTLLGLNTARGDVAAGEFGLGALPGRERDFLASVDEAIDYCRGSGAKAIHCMAGVVPAELRDNARRTLVANLREASVKAREHDLTLLLEPINSHDVPDYFYATSAEGAAIIAEVGSADVRLMFDCYHVGRGGRDVIAELKRFMPVIGHVQIAAVPSRAEPDEGELDYIPIFAALDRLHYDGWIGCEYKPRGPTGDGLAWLENLGVAV